MIRILIFLSLWATGHAIEAQDYQNKFRAVNEKVTGLQQTAFQIRGAWAIGNVAVGLTLRSGAIGSSRHFYGMNTLLNLVNFGIAAVGYIQNANASGNHYTLSETVKRSTAIQKKYLVSAGLDATLITAGYLLHRQGKQLGNRPMMTGYGSSFMLQGGFLLLFDLTFYYLHSLALKPAFQWMDQLQPTTTGTALGVIYRF